MWQDLRIHATETFTTLLKLHPEAKSQVQDFVKSPASMADTFTRLDTNGDRLVTVDEILGFDLRPDSPVGALLAVIETEMKLGAANEDISRLPGVDMGALVGDPTAILSGQSIPQSSSVSRQSNISR